MADAVKVHASQIEMVPVDALKGYEKNARTHPDTQIASLVAIIRDSGFTNPVLIDDNDVIVAGHGRLAAAKKLKMAEVPCVRLSGLSPEQIKAIRISDNRTALGSMWDEGLLKLELADLQGAGFDLSLTGFGGLELTSIFATREGHTDPDNVPEAPAVPVSKTGDLWLLGEHRIICGDCTSKEVIDRLFEGRRPVLCTTDAPYGVEYDPAFRSRLLKDGAHRAEGRVQNDDRADWREAWALFPGDVIYVWHDACNPAATQLALEACGFEVRSQIMWRKSSMAVGRGHYHWAHEACFYAVRKTGNGHWAGGRKQTTVWDIEAPKRSETGHGTQKPVQCMARPIINNSAVGDVVFDGFLGSGSSLIGAHMNKRVLLGCEVDPIYVDVTVLRWKQFSGLEALLAETGETFEQVKARRAEVV